MTPDELERERAALLAALEAGEPWTDELGRRVVEVARADRERALTDQTLAGHLDREIGAQLGALFAASEVSDAEPGSTTLDAQGGAYVRSARRGRVQIGTLDYRRLLAVTADYTEVLEAKRRAPLVAKADQKEARIRRAVELHRAGDSPNRIAQVMTAEGAIRGERDPVRTVKRWLAAARKSDTSR